MEHSYARDLKISLSCPSGKRVILHNFWGQSNPVEIFLGEPNDDDNEQPEPGIGYDYCWTPLANNGTWIEYSESATANTLDRHVDLPAGDYQPYQDFEEFIGCPLNGQWTIQVEDLWATDNGYIFSWQLNFAPQLYAATDPFSPAIVDFEWLNQDNLIYYSKDSIAATPGNAGRNAFDFKITDEYGCVFDTVATVPILPFSHPDCYDCFSREKPFELVADTTICRGDTVQLGTGIEAFQDTIRFVNMQSYTQLGHRLHPPDAPYSSIMNVEGIFPENLTNASEEILQICIDVLADPTEFISDYDIKLEAPSGEQLQLVSFQLFTEVGNALQQTCFTPVATQSINNGVQPFTGNFSPIGDWSDLDGATKNGAWKLVIADRLSGLQRASLNDWSITFTSQNTVNYSWSAASGLSCMDCPSPSVTPANSSSYVLRTRDNFNCSYRDTVNVSNIEDLEAPALNCVLLEQEEGLRIDWLPQAGVEQYEIRIDSNVFEVPNFNLFSHKITGMQINQEITIDVRAALDNLPENLDCSIPTTSTTCIYSACALRLNIIDGPIAAKCADSADGRLEVEVRQGAAPFRLFLDNLPISLSDPSSTLISLDTLTAGSHQLIIEDSDACFDTLNFVINAPDSLQLASMIQQPLCAGSTDGRIDVLAMGGISDVYQYEWSNTSDSPSLTNISAGDYEITVRDENNCTLTNTITVTAPDTLRIAPRNITDASCSDSTDGAIDIRVEGGTGTYTYAWSNAANTPLIDVLTAGTYIITVTDENACTMIDTIQVDAPDAIEIDTLFEIPVTCKGEATGIAIVRAAGGTMPYNYRWSDALGQTTDMAQELATGTYTVTVSDANNCTTSETVTITEPDALSVTFNPSAISCTNEADGEVTALPTGGTTPYTYEWDDPDMQSTATATGLMATTYTVTITDENDCTTTNEITLEEPDEALSVSVTQTYFSCYEANNSTATVTPIGGTGDYRYAWNDAQSQTTATATNLATGIYEVTVLDENECSTVATTTIDELENFQININASSPSCNGVADGELGATVLRGGTGTGITYIWDTDPPQSGFFIRGVSGGRTYNVTITDDQGCTGVEDYPMREPDPIQIEFSTIDVLCNEESTGSANITNITGGNPIGGYTIQWDANALNSTARLVENLGIGTYSVTATDTLGCMGIDTITIKQPSALEATFEVENNTCHNGTAGTIRAEIQGGQQDYDLIWSTGSRSATIENLIAGVYTLTVTDGNNCQIVRTEEVQQPSFLDPRPTITESIDCYGGNSGRIDLNPIGGTPPYTFKLNQGEYNTGTTFVGLNAGSYTIFMRDAEGCTQNTNLRLDNPAEFRAFIDTDLGTTNNFVTISEGDSLNLFSSALNEIGVVEWEWTLLSSTDSLICADCDTIAIAPTSTMQYALYGIDENGCEATARIQVRLARSEQELLVPTGFSPNGDQQNDVLLLHSKEAATVRIFRVYDRWGELLHELADFPVNDPSFHWDGTFRGQPMPAGSYLWTAEVEYTDDNTVRVFRGNTTLLR
ncbi:MAG: T9SS type B sorting domain-containing protein [Bacteroidota bacterium]